MRVKCCIEGCQSVYVSDENPSPQGVRYTCSHHTDEELRAAGVLRTERTDKDVQFQTVAFDSRLGKKINQHWTHPLPEKPDLYESALGDPNVPYQDKI